MQATLERPRTTRRPAIAGVDHAIVGVRDLKQAAIAWRRLGFRLTPRGKHIGWGTANYCIMFIDSYVELLGIVDPKQFTNNLDKFLASREGLMSLAFGTPGAENTAKSLRRAGVEAGDPKDLSRLLELGEDGVMPRFRLVMLPPAATPGLSAFVCQHMTPELLRFPSWLQHTNGAVSLKGLTAIASRPLDFAEAYERLLGKRAVSADSKGLHVQAGAARLSFVTPAAFAEAHNVPAKKMAPGLAGMTLGVARLDDTLQYFDDYGVPFARRRDVGVEIDPAQTAGVYLRFEAS